MKPAFLRNIPALSGKSREEIDAIICPLFKTDSKLRFYRKLWILMFIIPAPFFTFFHFSLASIATLFLLFLTGALIAVITITLITLFCVNPRLKEILEDKSV
jgi:hypothetical protein